jgi:acid phosphatase (class A)
MKMIHRNRRAVTLLLASLLTAPAALVAAPKGAMTDAPKPPHFLPTDAIDPVALLPDPPAPSSQEHREELQLILRLQHDRTPEQVATVKAQNSLSIFDFADLLGPAFTPKNCPQTDRFFKLLQQDEGYFAKLAKNHWQRPRPTASPGVHAVFPQGGWSYPSGHSTRATIYADLLAWTLPDHRDAFLERGREIGFGREIAGVHWPSDVLAGRMLGHTIARALLARDDVRTALTNLRPELDRSFAPAPAAATPAEPAVAR